MLRKDAITALNKIMTAQQAGNQMQEENSLINRLIQAMDSMGKVTSFTGPQGPKGDKGNDGYTPLKGVDYFTDSEIETLIRIVAPVKGKDYFDGGDGSNGKDGLKGEDGLDGIDGVANMDEVEGVMDKRMNSHTKEFNHALIHDSKMIGTYELDESTLQEGDLLQVKGKKLVGVKMPKPQQVVSSYNASQGVSNMRSFPVTASRELDAMGFYVVDATAGDITITVPSAAGRQDYWFELIRIDATNNVVTIVPTGAETMSGMTDYVMQQWTDVMLFAYNANYLIRKAT